MKKNLVWSDLLIIGGFQFNALSEAKFDLNGESRCNVEFLKHLLSSCSANFELNYSELHLLSEQPSPKEWIACLERIGGKCCELKFNPEEIELIILDTPMLGLIRQLNRLGMSTQYSCTGHGKKKPFIQFLNHDLALLASRVIKLFGYRSRVLPNNFLEISAQEVNLYEMGLALSELSKVDEGELEKILKAKQQGVLEKLLSIPGRSGEEDEIRNYLMKILPDLTDVVKVDCYGNILGTKRYGNGPTVLLSAHMDVVENFEADSQIVKNGNIWSRSQGILGADDRAGIAMILNIFSSISEDDFRGTLKIAFTVEEETGQRGAENIDAMFFWGVNYAISLDRRNGSDIVVRSNRQSYCTEAYGRVFETVSKQLGHGDNSYTCTMGGISDLRVWSQLGLDSVNLSVGFHNEHSPDEFLDLNEWHRCYELVVAGLKELGHTNSAFRRKPDSCPDVSAIGDKLVENGFVGRREIC